MGGAVRALIAAVVLGGVFGSANATIVSIDDEVMVVDFRVEVVASAESVVAHLSFDNEPELTLPMLEREPGIFGLQTELELKNYVVVFETLGEEGERSEPVTLAQMGAVLPRAEGGTATTVDDEGLSEESESLLWLAVALGAASLSLIAFWALGGREARAEREEGEPRDEEE